MTRKQLIDQLNEDLSREYQASIAYVIDSQVKGAQSMKIATEFEKHAGEELKHAVTRENLRQEQEHLNDLATALGEDPPYLSSK